jgi:hypothetical protein
MRDDGRTRHVIVIGDVAKQNNLSKFEHCMSGDTAGRVACTWILLPRLALRDAVSRRERKAIYAGTSPGNLSGSAERMMPGERHPCCAHGSDWGDSLGGTEERPVCF